MQTGVLNLPLFSVQISQHEMHIDIVGAVGNGGVESIDCPMVLIRLTVKFGQLN